MHGALDYFPDASFLDQLASTLCRDENPKLPDSPILSAFKQNTGGWKQVSFQLVSNEFLGLLPLQPRIGRIAP
jgi:hypothetical protein